MTKPQGLIQTITTWDHPKSWLKQGAGEDIMYRDWCEQEAARLTAGGEPCHVIMNSNGEIAIAPIIMEDSTH